MVATKSENSANNVRNRAVVIGIVKKDNKLLMIKRAKKEGELLWAFPGGKVEIGETKEEACVREVKEETNVEVKVIGVLGQQVHPNTNVDMTYFLCEYITGDAKVMDSSEILEVTYKSRDEFFRDVKTKIFLPVLEYINSNIQ